jgi:ferritin-like metal-binding protein YciE
LYSAEEQIIDALPLMIEKASNSALREALERHLRVTEEQKNRLDRIKELLPQSEEGGEEEKKGFIANLFSSSGKQTCRGMEGILDEGRKMLNLEMSPEVLDAVIIAGMARLKRMQEN